MTTEFERIKDEAFKLDKENQYLLIQELTLNILEQEETPLEKAWYDEVERRVQEIDRGEVKTYPADQVIKDLRTKLKEKQ